MSDIDNRRLRSALSSYMTGVTVVTARAANGELVGFTANSFTSVSLDPPLLLVCPGRHLNSFEVFATTTNFAISILAEGQEAVSNVFAGATRDRFEQVSWHPDEHACPLIEGACAWFSCTTHQLHEAGDHLILVGEINQFDWTGAEGLGYAGGSYFSLARERRSDTNRRAGLQGRACALIERDGHLLMVADDHGLHLPAVELENDAGARSTLDARFSARGLNLSTGAVYSVYDDLDRGIRTTAFLARAGTADTGSVGSWIAIESLATDRVADAAEASMLARYRLEQRNRDFGLYLGTSESGELHHTNDSQD